MNDEKINSKLKEFTSVFLLGTYDRIVFLFENLDNLIVFKNFFKENWKRFFDTDLQPYLDLNEIGSFIFRLELKTENDPIILVVHFRDIRHLNFESEFGEDSDCIIEVDEISYEDGEIQEGFFQS